MNELERRLRQSLRPRILVIGDLMLDLYTWGNATRISPEAPVLVLQSDQDEVRPGGAASVARLAHGLEADVTVFGIVGDDPEGRILCRILQEAGVQTDGILTRPERPTTTKHRFLARAADRHPHQVLRVDREEPRPIDLSAASPWREAVCQSIDQSDVVLVSDYDKGVCAPELLRLVIDRARDRGIPVLVDPARRADLERYRGATLLKPNRVEAECSAGRPLATRNDVLAYARNLRDTLDMESVLVTLDAEGMAFVNEHHCLALPTEARAVHDITGAGDMALAALGVGLGMGLPQLAAVHLANVAAGLEVQRLGIEVVTRREILTELTMCRSPWGKQLTLETAAARAEEYRQQGKRIVFTNGCFDLLHVGHLDMLQAASGQGDVLFVAINSDASVQRIKGPARPVIPEQARAGMLAALSHVDHLLVFDEETPHALLRAIRPDVLVKGGTTAEVVGREVVESHGGRIYHSLHVPSVSTTSLVGHE